MKPPKKKTLWSRIIARFRRAPAVPPPTPAQERRAMLVTLNNKLADVYLKIIDGERSVDDMLDGLHELRTIARDLESIKRQILNQIAADPAAVDAAIQKITSASEGEVS